MVAARTRLLDAVVAALEELRPFWPVTLRQVYYRLVAAQIIENTRGEYQRLSRVVGRGRLDGVVPWEAIEDRVRERLGSAGWPDANSFVRDHCDEFLRGYRRDLLDGQPWALEVWVEKDALSRICHQVAFPFCVPVVVARGFSSLTLVRECYDRVVEAVDEGRDGLRILYFGDLDPSGWEMLPALLRRLRRDMGLGDEVDGVRCALTPEQVSTFDLPQSLDAIKDTDTRTPRYRAWLAEHNHPPHLAVELDAIPPKVLQRLVRQAIEESLDMDLLEEERRREREDRTRIAGLRDEALDALELDGDES